MLVERLSRSEAETRVIGLAIGRVLRGGDVLLVDGALGAGKTTLTRAIAEGMGLATAAVASPTFVIAHEYRREGASAARPTLIHIDAYRLRDAEELETLGWESIARRLSSGTTGGVAAAGPSAAMIVEWAERVPELAARLPAGASVARLRLEHAGEHERALTIEAPAAWSSRPEAAALAVRGPTVCPITGKPVPTDSPTYPFADERARLADLNRWFTGSYTISREARDEDGEGA